MNKGELLQQINTNRRQLERYLFRPTQPINTTGQKRKSKNGCAPEINHFTNSNFLSMDLGAASQQCA
jgi:hypothetical protein